MQLIVINKIFYQQLIVSLCTSHAVADPGGVGGAQGARAPPPLKNVYKIEIL